MGARSFMFLHAADLHLDSPLLGLSAYPGAPADRLRSATRDAFANLVSTALERSVAFVIVAGDVFDGDWKDFSSGLWFASEVRRLVTAGIPLVLLRGNHDAESRITKSLRLPEGVHQFAAERASTVRLAGLDVALHGQSYAVPNVQENLVHGYPAPCPDVLNIGVLHTGLEGYEGHGRYAPCTAEDLRAKGYDYWALGHIHAREVVAESPWIVFPGNLQGRHARELGPKGATLAHVVDGRVSALEEVACDVARWAHVVVDVGQIDSDDDASEEGALRAIEDGLTRALAEADGRLLAARVTFTGASRLDSILRAEPLRIEAEVRARGVALSHDLWIERVRVETSGVAGADRGDDGFAALALRILGATLEPEEAAVLARELARLGVRLPARVAAAIQPSDPGAIQAAAEPAARYLAALLESTARTRGEPQA